MGAEADLRSVPVDSGSRARSWARPQIWLVAALVLTLALLAWSRLQLGQRIDELERERVRLEAAVAERDGVIAAQAGRLENIRARVREISELLDEPLPRVAP